MLEQSHLSHCNKEAVARWFVDYGLKAFSFGPSYLIEARMYAEAGAKSNEMLRNTFEGDQIVKKIKNCLSCKSCFCSNAERI